MINFKYYEHSKVSLPFSEDKTRSVGPTGGTMPLKVFVIEDEELIRDSLECLIVSRGHQVSSFSGPSFCLLTKVHNCDCLTKESCADIIITDINMPSISGLEFLEMLQSKGCQVKYFAVMSGGWKTEELEFAEKRGYKIFHKPFDIAEFIQWLEYCEDKILKSTGRLPNSKNKKAALTT
jgi:DNA-binding NtrC family response regulator